MDILGIVEILNVIVGYLRASDWAALCLTNKQIGRAAMKLRAGVRKRFFKFILGIIDGWDRYAFSIHDDLRSVFSINLGERVYIYMIHPDFIKTFKERFFWCNSDHTEKAFCDCGDCLYVAEEMKHRTFGHTPILLSDDYNYVTRSFDHSIQSFLTHDQYRILPRYVLGKFNDKINGGCEYARILTPYDGSECLVIYSKYDFDLLITRIQSRDDQTKFNGRICGELHNISHGIIWCSDVFVSWHRPSEPEIPYHRKRTQSLPIIRFFDAKYTNE